MNSTNKEHIILKEKLQGVELPDLDQAWEKMDEAIEATVPGAPASSSWLGKFRIYLNIFIGAILISSIGFYVASKPTQITKDLEVPKSGMSTGLTAMASNFGNFDHERNLPLPAPPSEKTMGIRFNNHPPVNRPTGIAPQINSGLMQEEAGSETFGEVNTHSVLPSEEIGLATSDDLPALNGVDQPSQPIDSDSFEFSNLVTEKDGTTEDEDEFSQSNYVKPFAKNQVGIKIQTMLMPEFSINNAIHNTGTSLFARTYLTHRSALHLELGYNPVVIRPITYVEKHVLFNNASYTQTDSALVNSLRYVSIPLCWYYQAHENVNIVIGPQISFLTGLKGDLNTRLSYPSAPEDRSMQRNASIENHGGFAKTNLGAIAEVNLQQNRFEFGIKLQLGFSDYTTDRIGTSVHRLNALQLKAAWLLNK